jgi:DNA-directed RNA polymerase alpha subunit
MRDVIRHAEKFAKFHYGENPSPTALEYAQSIIEMVEVTGLVVTDPSQVLAVMDWPISSLNLQIRAYNALLRNRIYTVGQLVMLREADLYDIRNFGEISFQNVVACLKDLGLELRGH